MIPDEFDPANSDVEVLLFVLTLSFINPDFFLNRAWAPPLVEEFGIDVLSEVELLLALDKPTCGLYVVA